MLVGKYVFVIFLSLFVIRNFKGTCSSIEMLKGYIGKVSLGTLTYVEAEAVEFCASASTEKGPLPPLPLLHPCWGGTVSFKAKFASV